MADKGYASQEFEDFVRELGATLVRPDRRDERRRSGQLGWIRQRIESIIHALRVPIGTRPGRVPLEGQLGLEAHRGRTRLGGPGRPASARPHRRHLAQLAHRGPGRALAGRL